MQSYKKQSSYIGKINNVITKTPIYTIYKNQTRKKRLDSLRDVGISKNKVTFIDHHLCHAASAYYGCPWYEEPVLVLTNDGSGDGLSSTVYIGNKGELKKIAQTPKCDSLGNIYARTTFMLGLVPLEHEWKIMGMAPYAPEDGTNKSYSVFSRFLRVCEGKPLTFKRSISEPTELIYRRLRNELELHRFDWIAGGVQQFTEELLVKWVRNCIEATKIHKVAMAGGMFMNVKANKRIMEIPELQDMFVFPSCGDESLSIGAAYQAYAEKCTRGGRAVDIQPLREIYFGPSFTDEDVQQEISNIENRDFEVEYVEDIEKKTAQLLAQGEIVARCKGRMEFGARALGNRSILADAADYSCVRTINMMVKKRDFWMPFAPVILKEHENDYILNFKNISSPYMMLSFDTTDKREEFISGVHQADMTARAQVLEKEWNPEFHSILKEFEIITGKAVLLNTSFNLHGYPIVYGPKEATWVFLNSDLRYLALGNYLLHK